MSFAYAGEIHAGDIRREASELLQSLDLYRFPVDVDTVAQRLGIQVNYTPLEEDYCGLLVLRQGRAVAHINSTHSQNRRRFSLAHEIGHFVLHEKGQVTADTAYIDKSMRLYSRKDRRAGPHDDHEKQANLFASELLMPEDLLRSKIIQEGYDLEDENDIARLAVVLRVSEQALSIRLRGMGNLLRSLYD